MRMSEYSIMNLNTISLWWLYPQSTSSLCTVEGSRPCPLCWVRCQASSLGQARWHTQHNGQMQVHFMTLRFVMADSTIMEKRYSTGTF
jgi:hypothetical protein